MSNLKEDVMIKYPSNPIVSSDFSKQKAFTYQTNPNDKPFHIVCQSKSWIPVSLLVFALDEEDARKKFMAAVDFMIEDRLAYANRNRNDYHHQTFAEQANRHVTRLRDLISGEGELKMSITEVKPNQFFKVGWACNDTIF